MWPVKPAEPPFVEGLTPDDEDAAVTLWRKKRVTRPWKDARADFQQALASDSSYLLGMRDAGRLVGTAMVTDDGRYGRVDYVAVASGAPEAEIASLLLEAAAKRLIARGMTRMIFGSGAMRLIRRYLGSEMLTIPGRIVRVDALVRFYADLT